MIEFTDKDLEQFKEFSNKFIEFCESVGVTVVDAEGKYKSHYKIFEELNKAICK